MNVSWTFSEIHVFVHIQFRPTHKHTNTPTHVSDLTTCFPTHGVLFAKFVCVCVCVCVPSIVAWFIVFSILAGNIM